MIRIGKNKTVLNIVFSLILQITNSICGFILPHILLTTFGSETNGIVSSLNQFLSYISLLEGGVTGVIAASLYKPLVEKDERQLSKVIKTAQQFFRKIAIVFAIYTIGLSVIYPLIVHTSFSVGYVASLTLILSINLFVQYFFSITWKTLLTADRKVYLVSAIQIVVVILNTMICVILISKFPSIHFIKFVSAIIYLIQPITYNYFVKKYYNLDKKEKPNQATISQRWDGFGINIAAFIHNNTDVVVLTLLSTLNNVSIYSVYFLVVSGLKSLIVSISSGISPTIGHAYAGGNADELNRKFDIYEFIMLTLAFFVFVIGGLTITPFVMLYTRNVTDADYYQPLFGWLITIAEMLFCVREPYVTVAYAANKFKDFTKIAYTEAILNIIISCLLVSKLGLIGVAIGTIISMGYRTITQVCYLHKHILRRSFLKLFRGSLLFGVGFLVIVFFSNILFEPICSTVIEWIIYAVKNSILAILVYGVIITIFYNKQISLIMTYISKGK